MRTKNCIKRITLTVIGIFLFQISHSQKNFLPGYIIQLNGDTLSGFIDYRNWEKNPEMISFREKPDDNIVHFSPASIEGFGVSDEIYESAELKTKVSPLANQDLEPNPGINIETIFLQAMIKGSKCLYCYKNEPENKFYIKNDSSYELLIYEKKLKNQGGQTLFIENTRYLAQLAYYLRDCPKIQSKMTGTIYSKKSLEDLFLYYYACTNSEIVFQKKTEKTLVEIGVLAGVSVTTLMLKSDVFTYLPRTNFNQSVDFTTGAYFDVILPRNQGKWSLCNELIFTSYKVEGSLYESLNENMHTLTTTTIGFKYIKINNMIRYKYPIRRVSLFVNVGISNGFVIGYLDSKKVESKFYDMERVEESATIQLVRKHEQGLIVGLGTKFKRYSFEIRVENGNGMSDNSFIGSSTSKYHFLLGYRL